MSEKQTLSGNKYFLAILLFIHSSFSLFAQAPTGMPMSFSASDCSPVFRNFNVVGESGAAPVTYTWNFGDFCSSPGNPNTATGSFTNHTYYCHGSYTVTLTASNAFGTTTSFLSVTARPLPTPNISILPSSPCIGDQVDFSGSRFPLMGENIVSWHWVINDPHDPSESTDQNTSHTFNHTGTYLVSLSVEDNFGCRASNTRSVHVCDPLPIQLMHFNGDVADKGVHLKWATATEKNNSHFEIQFSQDGINYQHVAIVKGAGNSSSPVRYSYTHYPETPGMIYYRLVQYNINGHIETIPLKAFTVEEALISISPNPSRDAFTLRLSGDKSAKVIVCNMMGEEKEQFEANGYTVFGEQLPKGTYLIKIITENSLKTIKAIKE